MPSIPELLKDHVTLEVECLDRLYLNGYIGSLATSGGLVTFMREQLGKPIPSPVVLGQVTEKFRESVKTLAEKEQIPVYHFNHQERKDNVANKIRQQRAIRDGIVFIGVAQEKAQAFQGKKIDGQFVYTRDKTVYVNHYYFYIEDADFGPLFLKVCSYALTLFQHLIDGFHNRDLRAQVVDLLGVTNDEYTTSQMTYDLRRLRLKGLIFRSPKTHRYFLTPYGWKIARLFSRLEARVFRPAIAMFTSNDAVLPFPLRASLHRVDSQLDELIYQAFPQAKAS